MLLCDDLTIEDLFYCAVAWSKTCLFFCQQFISYGLKSVEDNSEHDLARMADLADGMIVPKSQHSLKCTETVNVILSCFES